MDAVALIILVALLPVVIGVFLLIDRARDRQIEKDRHRPRVVVPLTDLALIASPLVVEGLLLLLSLSIRSPMAWRGWPAASAIG